MAYYKHPKEFWDTEAEWIVNEYVKPDRDRMFLFKPYVKMQYHHCETNGTSPEAAEKIKQVLARL